MNTRQLRQLALGILASVVLPLAATAMEFNGTGAAASAGDRYALSTEARAELQHAYTTFAADQRVALTLPTVPNRIAIGSMLPLEPAAVTARPEALAELRTPVSAQATP